MLHIAILLTFGNVKAVLGQYAGQGGDNTRLIWACQGENKRRHSIAPIVKTGVNFIEQMLERAQRRGRACPAIW